MYPLDGGSRGRVFRPHDLEGQLVTSIGYLDSPPGLSVNDISPKKGGRFFQGCETALRNRGRHRQSASPMLSPPVPVKGELAALVAFGDP